MLDIQCGLNMPMTKCAQVCWVPFSCAQRCQGDVTHLGEQCKWKAVVSINHMKLLLMDD